MHDDLHPWAITCLYRVNMQMASLLAALCILLFIFPGDSVGEDDVVAQIETDKVTIDVKYTSPTPGSITSILVKEGDTVVVGQEVAVVEQGAEGAAAGGGGGGGGAKEPAAAAEAAAPPPPKAEAAPPKPAAPATPPPTPTKVRDPRWRAAQDGGGGCHGPQGDGGDDSCTFCLGCYCWGSSWKVKWGAVGSLYRCNLTTSMRNMLLAALP